MARRHVLALCISALLTPAFACGPDFAPELLSDRAATMAGLPEGMFVWEASHLIQPQGDLRATPAPPWSADEPVSAEAQGLDPAQAARIEGARASADANSAYAALDGLPEDVRLYTAGAVAWHQMNNDEASARFNAVLALPDAQRKLRGVWAAFMLGRIALQAGDLPTARQHFQQTRDLRAAGGADPDDLAIGTWGAESKVLLEQGDLSGAVAGYAEQAARGDSGGTASLLVVARKLLRTPDALGPHIADPLVQKLVSGFAFSRKGFYVETQYDDAGNELPATEPAPPAAGEEIDYIVRAIDQAGLKTFAGADRLAAAAYGAGRYEVAERFVKLADGPLASWVDAKLKLRAGDKAAADASLAAASKAFAVDETWNDSNQYLSWPTQPKCRIAVEQSVLKLERGEYVAAAEDLFNAGPTYWADLSYVAERVLTLDELTALTTKLAPTYVPPPAKAEGADEYEPWPPQVNVGNQLRYLTARRLLRSGKSNEALALFDDAELKKQAQAYADALGASKSGGELERARHLSEAAALARSSGMELLGYEGDPDYQVYGGSFDSNDPTEWDADYNPIYKPRTDIGPPKAFSGADEGKRLEQSRAQPLQRFHYRFMAAQMAQDAAALVPPRSQAYAALMCKATTYVAYRSPETATTIYKQYLRTGAFVPWGRAFGTGDSYGSACPAPDFDKAQAQLDAIQRAKLKRIAKYAGPPVLGVLLLGIGFWWWRRRKAARA